MLSLLAPELPPDLRPARPVPLGEPDPEDLVLDSKAAQVARLHWAAFARLPGRADLDRWTGRLAEEEGEADRLAEEFVATAAFAERFGSDGTASFVQRLYQLVLGREAEPEGQATWVRALDSGALTRATVLRGLAESTEFRNRIKTLAYPL